MRSSLYRYRPFHHDYFPLQNFSSSRYYPGASLVADFDGFRLSRLPLVRRYYLFISFKPLGAARLVMKSASPASAASARHRPSTTSAARAAERVRRGARRRCYDAAYLPPSWRMPWQNASDAAALYYATHMMLDTAGHTVAAESAERRSIPTRHIEHTSFGARRDKLPQSRDTAASNTLRRIDAAERHDSFSAFP